MSKKQSRRFHLNQYQAAIEENPEITLKELAAKAGVKPQSAQRQLQILKRFGRLSNEQYRRIIGGSSRKQKPQARQPRSALKDSTDYWGILREPVQSASITETEPGAPAKDPLEFLRAQVRQLEGIIRVQQRALGQQSEIANSIREAVKAVPPYPAYKHRPATRGKNPVSAVLIYSDWHIGEVISKEETTGFGEYNYEIAEKRLLTILESQLHWIDVQRAAYPIEEIVVVGLGDYISGIIHQELLVTQEFPAVVQAVKAGHLLGEVLRRAASCAKTVRFEGIGADNHGRLDKKPQAKQKYLSGFSFVTHEIAREYTQKVPNLKFKTYLSMKEIITINKWKFLCSHGDTIRGWAGLPFYGFARDRGREAMRRMFSEERGFHYMVYGHFHVPSLIEGVTIVNGSLSGTSEFDHSQGRHAKPCQVAFFVHPEHGIFNLTAFSA